jgi:hypothetical protein
MISHAVGSPGSFLSYTADDGFIWRVIRRLEDTHAREDKMERKTKDATDDAMATKCKDPLMLDKRLKNLGFKKFEGGTDHVEFENEMTLAREVNARAICQTGFNTGTSALAFLCAHEATRVFSFDLGAHGYVKDSGNHLKSLFGQDRVQLFLGKSQKTLRKAIKAGGVEPGVLCVFAFVDGGHTFDIAMSDIIHFRNLTKPNSRIVVENCNVDGRVCGYGGLAPVNEAYRVSVKRGIVTHNKQISTQCGQCDQKCRELCIGTYT